MNLALHNFFISIWYRKPCLTSYLLTPLSILYRIIIAIRKFFYRVGIFRSTKLPVPVIIIGNITVGGTGKTPLVIWLANYLESKKLKPGIVSRGYKANKSHNGVIQDSDETLLIKQKTNCPVAIAQKKAEGGFKLIKEYNCDIIICDDGLQHYALKRDIEIAVIDGERRFGNGFCLPAGPLREPVSRLNSVNYIIVNGKALSPNEIPMQLIPKSFYNLKNPSLKKNIDEFSGIKVHAVAGIGNPKRFFNTLRELKIEIIEHPFPDHFQFTPADLNFNDDLPIIMTEKDAVKCEGFAQDNFWVLSVAAEIEDTQWKLFDKQMIKYLFAAIYFKQN